MDADTRLHPVPQPHTSSSSPSTLSTPSSQTQTYGHGLDAAAAHTTSANAAPVGSSTAVEEPARCTGGDDGIDDDPLADVKRPRACEACRQLKVRCDPDPDHPAGSCKRCAKANRRCVVTAPTRKRQKKSDSRVAELEKRIDSLTASLQASQARSHGPTAAAGAGLVTQEPPAQGNGGSGSGSGAVGGRSSPGRWLGQSTQFNEGTGVRCSDGCVDTAEPAGAAATTLAGRKRQSTGDVVRPGFGCTGAVASSSTRANNSADAQSGPGISDHGASSDHPWPALYDALPKTHSEIEYEDVIDRGVVDIETATAAFNRYMESFAPLMPFVIFPEGTTIADIRRAKPVLLLTILSISIVPMHAALQMPLVKELHQVFADRIVVRGGKSLELVQALIIATIWYLPPDHFEELKFYQFLHLAIVTGMELGMNRRSTVNARSGPVWREIISRRVPHVHPDDLDARRAWLGCYFMSSTASVALRRPLLVRWNPYMDECMQLLRDSPESTASDTAIIYWVKLARLGEEITFQFSMDDPVTNVSITDAKTQYAMKGFERQLADWRAEVPSNVYSPLMQHYASVTNIYLHEIALHVDHNIDDFRPPFISGLSGEAQTDRGSAVHVEALTSCLTSIHDAYEVLCSMDTASFYSLPSFQFVRTSYATVALIKLNKAATAPGSKLGEVFRPSDLQIEYFLDKVIQRLKRAAENDAGRIVSRFAVIMSMLKTWFLKDEAGGQLFSLPHFFQSKKDCTRLHESDAETAPHAGSGSSQTQNPASSRSASLRVLSEVALGRPDEAQRDGQFEPSVEPSAPPPGSNAFQPTANAIVNNPGPVSLSTGVPVDHAFANVPSDKQWSQLAGQSMSGPYSPSPALRTLLDHQQAYAQQQELIQASQFAGAYQPTPQQLQQQQVADFMAELDTVVFQPDGLAVWGNMWDEMLWPFPPSENAST